MAIDAAWLRERAGELATSLRLLTRLRLRVRAPQAALAAAVWAFPVAGALVGAAGGLVYRLAERLGLPAWPAAALALAATMAATGCLHEDGLADTADGFGGGGTRDSKLAIMHDSRLGTYGVCALVLSILLRAGALAGFADGALAMAALVAAHAAARAAMAVFMAVVGPARSDGLSAAFGRPPGRRAGLAAVLGGLIVVFCLGPRSGLAAAALVALAVALLARLSRAQIGGQTGDVLGAAEQVGEIVVLLVALARPG